MSGTKSVSAELSATSSSAPYAQPYVSASSSTVHPDFRDPADPPLYAADGTIADDIAAIQSAAAGSNPTLSVEPAKIDDSITPTSAGLVGEDNFEDQSWTNTYLAWRSLQTDEVALNFFEAIRNGQDDLINTLITGGLVTASTQDAFQRTPLSIAVNSGNIRIVQELVDFGADVNEWSSYYESDPTKSFHYQEDGVTRRTPLMIAAEKGNLTIVKLLIEAYHADDKLIAKDGQIALRLAASNGHREVVDYLPSRSGGGMKRWKHKNRKAIRAIKLAAHHTVTFVKFFVYDVPRFFVWSIPKHLIVLPLIRTGKYLNKNRSKLVGIFFGWLKKQAIWLYKTAKAFPVRLYKFTKELIKFFWEVAKWGWRVLTIHLPHAVVVTFKFAWKTLKRSSVAVWGFLTKIASAVHTLVLKVLNLIKSLTWADVANGFKEVLRVIFVKFPMNVVWFFRNFGTYLGKAFGCLGDCLWFIVTCLWEVTIFLPRMFWRMLVGLGDILARGGHEVRVWYNPKAI